MYDSFLDVKKISFGISKQCITLKNMEVNILMFTNIYTHTHTHNVPLLLIETIYLILPWFYEDVWSL